MRFTNKCVLVTGASRGIGRALAQAFRDEGAHVAGTHTGQNIPSATCCDEWLSGDFSDAAQIQAVAEWVRRETPDVLINNAGINKIAPFVQVDPDDFLRIHRVNVFAPFMLSQAAVPGMKAKGWGRIVNVSSIWGKIGKEQRASYASSKFAVDGMTLALAAEHTADGILANCVAPGFIDTELTRQVLGEAGIRALVAGVPARRLGRVDEVARVVLWLASEDNTFIAGQNIAIDGGFTRV
jgi:3-oxoacyl-[acyl-carrier protein] reductase